MRELRTFALGLLLAAFLADAAVADPGSDNVLQVLIVQVAPGKIPDYLERVEKLAAIQERLGTVGKFRMWSATPVGKTVGNVIVSIEYTDMNAFAENYGKLEADPEWQQVMGGMPEIRELLSSGLYTEITPEP